MQSTSLYNPTGNYLASRRSPHIKLTHEQMSALESLILLCNPTEREVNQNASEKSRLEKEIFSHKEELSKVNMAYNQLLESERDLVSELTKDVDCAIDQIVDLEELLIHKTKATDTWRKMWSEKSQKVTELEQKVSDMERLIKVTNALHKQRLSRRDKRIRDLEAEIEDSDKVVNLESEALQPKKRRKRRPTAEIEAEFKALYGSKATNTRAPPAGYEAMTEKEFICDLSTKAETLRKMGL